MNSGGAVSFPLVGKPLKGRGPRWKIRLPPAEKTLKLAGGRCGRFVYHVRTLHNQVLGTGTKK
jgi:hypothetical protein